ncbi:zn2 cys6 DNA-binding protein [Alternaria alternata]|nr:zn2 cys6 DNA-binding protein [Alternaria alternata]
MVSKQIAKKRRRTSNTPAQSKRRRTTRLALTDASGPYRAHASASEVFWAATRILEDNGTRYLVEWDGIEPGTGRPYEPTWEPHNFVTLALEADWKKPIAAQSTATRRIHNQAQSFEEAGNRVQSSSESPETVAFGQSPIEGISRCLSVSTASPQQMRQPQRNPNSLLQDPEPTAQNNASLTISTMTTREETLGSNQRDPAIADGSGHTDDHLSAIEPTALDSRHSLLAQPSPRIEEVGGVGHMQLPSHPDVVAKLQDAGCKEDEIPENSRQKGPGPWELASRESRRAHACTLDEKDSPLSALLTTREGLETREQQEMPGKLEILEAMPSPPTNEAVHREPKLQAASKAMSSIKRSSEPTLEKATPLPLPGGSVEELYLASVRSERSPRRLSKDDWIHEKTAIQHATAEPDMSDEPSGFLARSERSMSLSAKQSEFIVQHRRTRACTVPMAATDRAPIAPSALSTQLGLRPDTKTTAGRAFVKQDVSVLAGSRNAKTCPLSAVVLTVCARHTSEQNKPLKADIRDLRDPTTSNWSVREPEIVPEREEQIRVANSMDTTDRNRNDSIARVSLSPEPPSGGEVDQNSASRRYENGCRTVSRFASPVIESVDTSPTSPNGGLRPTHERADQFSDELAVVPRSLREPTVTASCGSLSINQKRLQNTEPAPQHIQPPQPLVDDGRYAQQCTALSYELSQCDIQSSQHRDACPVKPTYGNATLASEPHTPMRRTDQSSVDRAVATKPMDGAAHIGQRRNKPFMKRVKTGCGICRRRKKKCDEAKPECNNCTRIGIACQGYMHKMKLQRNGNSTSLPSLSDQAPKPVDTHQPQSRPRRCNLADILNNEPSLAGDHSIYQEPHAPVQRADTNGGVTVEEREYQLPAPSRETNRHDLFRALQPREQSYPCHPRYPLAPVHVHERDVSNEDRQAMHPIQIPPLVYHKARGHDQPPHNMDPSTAIPSTPASDAYHQRTQSSRSCIPAFTKMTLSKPSLCWRKQAASLPKTEKQKMLDGEPFMPCDTQLVDDRRQCAAMLYHFNNTVDAIPELVQDMRERYFRAAIDAACTQPRCGDSPGSGQLGSNAHVVIPFHCDYGYNVSIGDNVIIGPNSRLLDSAKISIGRNTRIGACVIITTLEAPTDTEASKISCSLEVARDVYIGENVYIGDCCVVGAGVRVGNGAITRSGSLVTCDIPPNFIACGNPADAYKAGLVRYH